MKSDKSVSLHRLLFAILICLVTGVAACQGGGGSSSGFTTNYHTGMKGLEFVVDPRSVPDVVYPGDLVSIQYEIRNSGAADVDPNMPGLISLTYDPFYVTPENPQIVNTGIISDAVALIGKSAGYPQGELQTGEIFMSINEIQGQREAPETKIIAHTCYPYFTVFSDDVCIDFSKFGNDIRDTSCTAKDLSGSSQGAPIAVTNVEVKMLRYKQGNVQGIQPTFKIKIRNLGGGTVLSVLETDTEPGPICTGTSIDRDIYNKVGVLAELGGVPLDCDDHMVELRQNEAEIRCKVRDEDVLISKSGNYQSNLMIDLLYIYRDSTIVPIRIERS